MTAGLYMAAMGPEGLKQAALQSMSKAHYLARELCKLPGVEMVNSGEYFHEFVTTLPKAEEVLKALEDNDILGGLPVEGGVLWCATEKVSKADLDKTVAIVKEVLA
jgi:glycine dehydrogenase subunit 1